MGWSHYWKFVTVIKRCHGLPRPLWTEGVFHVESELLGVWKLLWSHWKWKEEKTVSQNRRMNPTQRDRLMIPLVITSSCWRSSGRNEGEFFKSTSAWIWDRAWYMLFTEIMNSKQPQTNRPHTSFYLAWCKKVTIPVQICTRYPERGQQRIQNLGNDNNEMDGI